MSMTEPCHARPDHKRVQSLHMAALGPGSHLYAEDHRGHGASTNTGDPATYAIERLVDDLEAWADAVIGEPFDLLGHSMGGRLALLLTLRRPDLVKSLILMDTTAWAMVADGTNLADQLRALTDEQLLKYVTTPGQYPESILIRQTVPQTWTDDNLPNKAGVDVIAARARTADLRRRPRSWRTPR
jgi:pimeloyl-ACP methyl ester carboxylesterase